MYNSPIKNDKLIQEAYEKGYRDALNEALPPSQYQTPGGTNPYQGPGLPQTTPVDEYGNPDPSRMTKEQLYWYYATKGFMIK
tara:strand:+ start:1254 stop:1499 length:246 start_codon:yes stop_codon:yes gene_type:complete